MVRKSTIIALMMLLSIASINVLFAQAKEACEPSSCGPSGTKKNEAKAITALRVDLQNVINQLEKVDINYKSSFSTLNIDQGITDDESLTIIYAATQYIREAILSNESKEAVLAELTKKPSPGNTSRELMITSRQQVKLLADQARRL